LFRAFGESIRGGGLQCLVNVLDAPLLGRLGGLELAEPVGDLRGLVLASKGDEGGGAGLVVVRVPEGDRLARLNYWRKKEERHT